MSTEPAGLPPGATVAVTLPAFRLASARVSRVMTDLELAGAELLQQRDEARREREEALQRAGKLQARVEELEALLRDIVSTDPYEADPGTLWWDARVALGLDGRTGHRDVNAEASA